MEQIGLIASLSNAKKIIPVDSIVSIKDATDGKLYTVLKITIEQNGVVKYALTLSETGVHTTTVYENKIVLVKKSKDMDTINLDYDAKTDSEVLEKVNKLMKLLKTNNSRTTSIANAVKAGNWWKVRDGVDLNTVADDAIPLVVFNFVKSNSYVYNSFVPAGDTYIYIYYPGGKFEMISRDIRLKPFYKRIFNTLLYGRDNINNFDIIETVFDYRKRYDSYLSNLYSVQYDAIRITGDHITP